MLTASRGLVTHVLPIRYDASCSFCASLVERGEKAHLELVGVLNDGSEGPHSSQDAHEAPEAGQEDVEVFEGALGLLAADPQDNGQDEVHGCEPAQSIARH